MARSLDIPRSALRAWVMRALGQPMSRVPALFATRAPAKPVTAPMAALCPVVATVRAALAAVEGVR